MISSLLALTALARPAPPPSTAALAPTVDVPFTQFTLPNGLRVIVHEDHKAPIVAVSVWYGVGSKDEPPGRTGFAHLFEHLMFNGSEHYDDEYFKPFEDVGATGQNGTTSYDRTNYFETVPTPALEMALWMESDRMGHLLGAIDQAKLDEQRGVVQNEKRQGDNQPYGKLEYLIQAGVFPEGHPYHHTVIGSMDDLNAAALDDVKDWFRTYYGAANTVLVLAGDTTEAAAKPLVEKYFGDIASGPPLAHMQQWVPIRTDDVVETTWDHVPHVQVDRVWAIPGRTTKDGVLLELAASVLGDGKTSRLYQKLVHEQQVCTDVSVSIDANKIASELTVELTMADGQDPVAALATVDQLVADFLQTGPTPDELGRARTKIGAAQVRGLEQIGGFGGKAVVLAQGELYADDPTFLFKQRIDWMNAATPADIAAVAKTWMSHGYYQVTTEPTPKLETTPSTADRSKLPAVSSVPELSFPAVQEGKLANGTKVVLAERHAVPVVQMALQFDAGFASDPVDHRGLSAFTSAMLDEGTKSRSGLELASQLESLGARLTTSAQLDSSTITMSALVANLKPSVALMADVVKNPAFDKDEIERQRARSLAALAQEQAQPQTLALRLLPPELYGANHPYGAPLTGTGDAASIQALDRKDLVHYDETWLRPDNATLFVVGDTTMDKLLPILNDAFSDWKAPKDPLPKKAVTPVTPPGKSKIVLIDKPDAEQTMILVGLVAPPSGAPENLALTAMNDVIGGQFSSRLNMNLREDKHWAYGAYTRLVNAVGQRPYLAFAPVQTDKTAPAMAEIQRELTGFVGEKPATADELDRVVKNDTRSLPGDFETSSAVLNSLMESARYGRPWNYPATLTKGYQALTLDQVRSEAKAVIHPGAIVWVVVGDRSKIEEPIKALNLAPIEVRKL